MTSAGASRPLRADARRNRARVLAAAEEVFAAKGTGASTDEVARAAGVGIGTVFRHFPTKEALLAAVLVDHLRRLAEQADALADARDAGAALFGFFTHVVEQAGGKNAYTGALAEAGVDVGGTTAEFGARMRSALERLLARAQRDGAVRPDVGVAELLALMVGVSRAGEHAGREVQARAAAIVLDGLRPRAADI
ncbi:TetR/AcrR family transcriptional regulator [Sphaerisporangium aureirubrum]|uniref:TetR/AcrR family transcriptional regulator n=1 Tax=Sphaerisporangium aureirubrum TaxID=1544736 RepID=A0ABW1NKC1_9ACTN